MTGATKPCRVCRSEIAAAASKCLHCGERQNIWGRLALSQSVLSLLVALLSVAGIVAPVLRETFLDPRDSALAAEFQFVNGDRPVLWLTNAGTRPGSVGELILEFRPIASGFDWLEDETGRLVFLWERDRPDAVIAAGEAHQARFELVESAGFFRLYPPGRLDAFEAAYAASDGTACSLRLVTFAFSGNRSDLPVAAPCGPLARLATVLLR